jgi:hypothetical protein
MFEWFILPGLTIYRLLKDGKIEKAQSLRKLARLGFEYYVAKNYREGRITLRNTADLLNLNFSETVDLLIEMGVKGNIRAGDIYASLNSIAPLDPTND